MKRKKISIGISVHNEEKNIFHLLESIDRQQSVSYTVQELLIISDGSTDRTNHIIESYKSKFPIVLIKGKKRQGKTQRLNEIFSKAKGDYIVLFDGDVILGTDTVIDMLSQHLGTDADLVAGNALPLPGKTTIERGVNASFEIYYYARKKYKEGNNPHSCIGRVIGISKRLAQQITLPKDTIGNDAYIYFSCITRKCTFTFVPSAIVYFRSPSSIADHTKQLLRYESVSTWMSKYFGKELVTQEYFLPRRFLYRGIVQTAIHDPLGLFCILCVNNFIRLRYRNKKINSLWPVSHSSKTIFSPAF